jgi:hypothetical protein
LLTGNRREATKGISQDESSHAQVYIAVFNMNQFQLHAGLWTSRGLFLLAVIGLGVTAGAQNPALPTPPTNNVQPTVTAAG